MGKTEHCRDNIFAYLQKFKDVDFSERSFNEVDGLVLAQLSYLKFDGIVPQMKDAKEGIVFKRILLQKNWKQLFRDERYIEDNHELFRLMLRSKRFGEMKLNYQVDVVDDEREVQFSAITCMPENAPVCIVFRGTDENIVGWKENFNMIYKSPVPAQEYAATYINKVAANVTQDLIICGHSKGGNLAVFAAAKCLEEINDRIIRVYNYDGPGFWENFLKNKEYKQIAKKTKKYVTKESLIGYLLFSDEKETLIATCGKGIKQHYIYNWRVRGNHFIREKEYGKIKPDTAEWNKKLEALPQQEAQAAIDAIYALIKASEAGKVQELSTERLHRAITVLAAVKNLDRDTIKMLKEAVSMITSSD